MPDTIDETGAPVLIEAVYYRHFTVYRHACDTVEEAKGYLCYGEDDGSLSSVGVFVDGKPVLYDVYVDPHPPTADEAREMLDSYVKAEPSV